jgi:hypothetical protein
VPHTNDRTAKFAESLPRETELHQIIGFTSDLNNASLQSNFVQQPNYEPDSDLNFEKGEVIYENKDVESGVTLVRQLGYTAFAYSAMSMAQVMRSGQAIYPIGDEFNDIRTTGGVGEESYNWLFRAI